MVDDRGYPRALARIGVKCQRSQAYQTLAKFPGDHMGARKPTLGRIDHSITARLAQADTTSR